MQQMTGKGLLSVAFEVSNGLLSQCRASPDC
jgi:hypothetical protein